MNCEDCSGTGRVRLCPPGWRYFYPAPCPSCGGSGEAEDDRELEEAVARMIAEGSPDRGGDE